MLKASEYVPELGAGLCLSAGPGRGLRSGLRRAHGHLLERRWRSAPARIVRDRSRLRHRRPVRASSTKFDFALGPSLAFDGKNYGAIYTGHTNVSSSFFSGLARDGSVVIAETALTDINSETYAGAVLHNGSFFERSWEDARQ